MITENEFKQVFDYIQKFVHGPITGPTYTGYKEVKKVRVKHKASGANAEAFLTFWKEFPTSAQFTYKGVLFKSERTLKANQRVCEQKYNKILEEDKISPEVLLRCLQVEIATRKEESYLHWRKENKLHVMNGCEVWLNQKRYIGYLDREMPVQEVTNILYTEA